MKAINIHNRIINQSKDQISPLLDTLSTKEDKIWPYEKWPAMRFKDGLKVGSKGGHGSIRYTIIKHIEGELIEFEFSLPKGFNGVHRFEITKLEKEKTEIKHTIDMNLKGMAILSWIFLIRRFHDALLEDALDKVENHFAIEKKITKWSIWVRFWRQVLKGKK